MWWNEQNLFRSSFGGGFSGFRSAVYGSRSCLRSGATEQSIKDMDKLLDKGSSSRPRNRP